MSFNLGPIEVWLVGLIGLGVMSFLFVMFRKVDALATQLPRMLDRQETQGRDIDGIRAQLNKLTHEITEMRIREAEHRGAKKHESE